MLRSITELPQAQFSHADVQAGRLPALQAIMALEHGPIFRWAGGPRGEESVYMVGPEANRFVLHTGREHFSHDAGWTPIIGDALGKGLLNMDPPLHTHHRRLWNPAFTATAMEDYLPTIERVVAARVERWLGLPEVNALAETRAITFDAAACALAGFATRPQLDELRALFYLQDKADVARRTQLLLGLLAERRGAPADERSRDVVGKIMRARDEDGRPLSDAQIVDHINILLVAGHETTTVLSAWVLYLLATLPEQRQRIEAELDTLLGDDDGPLTLDALRRMKRLDNFIKEAGRLHAPLLNAPRGVVRAFEFGGYEIPAGAQVRLALAAGHLLPDVFAEPGRFDPERFAPPREEDRRTPYGLVTFGGGVRSCIGMHFAQIETKTLAAYVLRRYRLEVLDGPRPAHAGEFVGVPSEAIRLRVSAR
jgi:cytochrome P450